MNIQDILQRFPTQEACLTFLETLRWGNTPRCPKCDRIPDGKTKAVRGG